MRQGGRVCRKPYADSWPKAMIAFAMELMRVERSQYRLRPAGASLMGAPFDWSLAFILILIAGASILMALGPVFS